MQRTTARSLRRFVAAFSLTLSFVLVQLACDPDTSDGSDAVDHETGLPCKSSSDCPSGFCIPLAGEPLGGRAVCTRPCTDTKECVAGWACAPVPGQQNLCQCQSSPEACDGKDNDCNGVIDDNPAATEWCGSNIGYGPFTCENATCTCHAPFAKCPHGPTFACVDLLTDQQHCGTCGIPCPQGSTCDHGTCRCPGNLTPCAAGCVDLESDVNHCGGCGLACNYGLSCIAGACKCPLGVHDECPIEFGRQCGVDGRCRKEEILQSYGDFVGAIALSSTHVFYSSRPGIAGYVDRSIRRVAKSGGVADTVVSLTQQQVPSLASDGTDLFYGTRKVDLTQDTIVRCPGGTCGASAVELAAGTTATAIAVKGGFVYWLDGQTGEPKRCAVTGCSGTPSVLAAAPAITARGSSGIWEGFIAVDGTDVFIGYPGNGSANASLIAKVPLAGGTLVTIANASQVNGLAESGATIFFLDPPNLLSVPKAGGVSPTSLTYAGPAIALVATDTNLYWAQPTYFALKCPIGACTGPALAISNRLQNPRALAVDAQFVYAGGHTLSRFEN